MTIWYGIIPVIFARIGICSWIDHFSAFTAYVAIMMIPRLLIIIIMINCTFAGKCNSGSRKPARWELVGAYARGPAFSWVHCQHV